MAPSRTRLLWIVVVMAVAGVAFLWLRGTPHSRAEALLLDLETGVVHGNGRLLAYLLDRDYPVLERWPELASFATDEDDSDPRQAVARALSAAFLQERGAQRTVNQQLVSLEPDTTADHRWIALFTIHLDVVDGNYSRRFPSLQGHRFVLQQRGVIFPAFHIIDHDPITLR